MRDLAAGAPFAAIDRLELVATPGSLAEATLDLAYGRVGCRAALLARGAAGAGALPGELGAELRARRAMAQAVVQDSTAAGTLLLADAAADATTLRLRGAWAAYERRAFDSAATLFGSAADSTPSVVERLEIRVMSAQAGLDAGTSQHAARVFASVLDSARALDSLVAASDGSRAAAVAALAEALVARRGIGLLWSSDAADGRLVMTGPGGAPRTLTRDAIGAGFTALGPAAADAGARALAWTAGGSGLGGVRALADTLGEADARVARGSARLARLDAERPARLAGVASLLGTIRGMRDTLSAAARERSALADSLARRDSAISATTSEYRRLIEGKIATARELARQNQARLDSIALAARAAGALTARILEAEQGTDSAYLAVATAAESGLDGGMTRLDIVLQRDTAHARYEQFAASLRTAEAELDSALAKAVTDSAARTAGLEAVRALAAAELASAREAQAAITRRAAESVREALVSRIPALRGRLAAVTEAAAHGAAAALFFVAIEADSAGAVEAEAAQHRESALAALTSALGAWPRSGLRPALLEEAGELLVRKADADYAGAQRVAGPAAPERPDYRAAIARFDELIRDYPADPRADAAAYTMGTIALIAQRYDDAARAFALVESRAGSPYRAEAFFRDGDGQFEQAVKLAGDARRASFANAARAYEQALAGSPEGGDIYFLSLYKLGWSDYMQAERQSSDEYRRAVDVFARLVREMDSLPPAKQARLALRQEAIDYLAIAITQLGGPDEGVRYLGGIADVGTRMLVLRRVAHALRDQGEFNNAIIAFRGALAQAPLHPAVLETRVELVDLFQSRMIEPARAQEARMELVDSLAPGGTWAAANPARRADAEAAREKALRDAGAYELASARERGGQGRFDVAARIFARYLAEFPASDSAAHISALEGDARFGARDWFASGVAYSRTSARWPGDSVLAAVARRNAVVAFDSALVSSRRGGSAAAAGTEGSAAGGAGAAPGTRSLEDSLFAATRRFANGASSTDARAALVAMGRRASEAQRWDVVEATFALVANRWPADPGAADARKLVGDAVYRQGRYAEAQAEWARAYADAAGSGRGRLADSIATVRVAAASQVADSLTRRGAYVAAADSILAPLARDIGDAPRAADLLRNAVEVHMAADSAALAAGDAAASHAARLRAIAGIESLSARFPAYEHILAYSALRARLLSDVGRPAEAAAALDALADANPKWPGRADGMVRAAAILDSLGRPAEAAHAYEKFSGAFPSDRRAADAQYNAAVIRRDAGDAAGAARSFLAFSTRFPRDARVAEATAARVAALRAAGDTAGVGAVLAQVCAKPAPAMAATCADRAGAAAFHAGLARWDAYAAMQLEVRTRAQLTRAGVDAASAPKLAAFRAITRAFTQAIATGVPQWVAAGTFQTGLAQWYYGLFLRDVSLPPDISEAQRTGAEQGSAQQAQQYFDLAIKTWTALVEKADAGKFDNEWVARARAAIQGDGIPARAKAP